MCPVLEICKGLLSLLCGLFFFFFGSAVSHVEEFGSVFRLHLQSSRDLVRAMLPHPCHLWHVWCCSGSNAIPVMTTAHHRSFPNHCRGPACFAPPGMKMAYVYLVAGSKKMKE